MSSQQRKEAVYLYLGEVDYESAWRLQKALFGARLHGSIPDVLLLLQHPHTITMGKSGSDENLLTPPAVLAKKGVQFVQTDRGGDVTYHGPGQLVGYPILNLTEMKPDVGWYLRRLEEAIIRTLEEYGISAGRQPGYTGVWVGQEKIAAIGVKVSRWVTMHGFALNVSTDLSYFDLIIPCGIRGRGVCSMQKLLQRKLKVEEIVPKVVGQFGKTFGRKMMPYNHFSWPELKEILEEAGQPQLAENGI